MKTFMQKENEGWFSLTTDERMSLEGSAGISVCSPGRQGQKNSSWQQCFNGWLQRKHFRIQIISQQIHVNFNQDGISDHLLTFALVFAKTTFGSWEYSGFSQSSPLFNGKHLCGETFIFSVVFVILYIYLELRRKQVFPKIFHLRKLLVVVKVSGVNLRQRNHHQSMYINIFRYICI